MPGLEKAATRILQALASGESIVIYADYDVDGVSAAAVLWHTLRAIRPDARVETYLPHRLEEGYGLNPEAIAKLCDTHSLIISVDCGITAVAPARVARERGVDLIITDHHTPPQKEAGLPDAFALVHPLIPGREPYPFPHLCGAGVAFKLAWRLATLYSGGERVRPELRSLLIELVALAAMGVIADVVPLRGENRVLAHFGLDQIRRSSLAGVRALRDESKLGGENVEAADIGFRLGPRLNAVGRLGHAKEALELLTSADEARSKEIARALTGWNNERRTTEAAITKAAQELAITRGMTVEGHRAIVLADPAWHRGVVGICCSRLVGLFSRPVILLQQEGDLCHGSARSIDGFDLHSAITACSAHVESFGGHAMAAGLKVRTDRLADFTRAFVEHANALLTPADLVQSMWIDAECEIRELDQPGVASLASLSPYGRDNYEPRVLLREVQIAGPIRPLGSNGSHVAFDVKQGNRLLRVKGWGWAPELARSDLSLRPGSRIDAVVVPGLNTWNGRTSVEAVLHDLRIV